MMSIPTVSTGESTGALVKLQHNLIECGENKVVHTQPMMYLSSVGVMCWLITMCNTENTPTAAKHFSVT